MFNPMLNRSTAAENASRHLAELVPLAGSPVLEEHFLHEGIWQITLSYFPASPHANGSAIREYKSFAIDGRTGEVLSMKIRNPKA